MTAARLWLVTRRAPLRPRERNVYTERWAVLATTADEAIAKIKQAQGADLVADEPRLARYLDGTWRAELEASGYMGMHYVSEAATAADLAARPGRKVRA